MMRPHVWQYIDPSAGAGAVAALRVGRVDMALEICPVQDASWEGNGSQGR